MRARGGVYPPPPAVDGGVGSARQGCRQVPGWGGGWGRPGRGAAGRAGGGAAGAGGPVALRVLLLWLQRAQAQAWREGVRCVSFVLLVGAVGQAVAGAVAVCRTAEGWRVPCAVRPGCGCSAD